MSPTETVTISMTPSAAQQASGAPPSEPSAPQRELTIPRQLGPVRLLSELGRGGMGVVWLGEHELLRRSVAVKFMLNAVEADDPGFRMFLEGARAAAAVRHLGLTAVLHADLIERVPYLVMEYVDGPSLSQILDETGPFPQEACVAIVIQVADAVSDLHDHSIVHRDIKPSNVLLDASGKAYVTDFGLSCVRPIGSEDDTSRVIGTPAYMSPELRDGRASARSDVFAMGVTMYQLLTNELPDLTGIKLGAPMTIGEAGLARLRRAGVDEALVDVIGRATNENPVYRFKSARFLHRALSEIPKTRDGAAAVARLIRRMNATSSDVSTLAPSVPDSSFDRAERSVADAVARFVESKRRVTGNATAASPARSLEAPIPSRGMIRSTSDRAERSPEAIACASCGFDLRWQRLDANCPECGLEVSKSVDQSLLRYQDGNWLRRTVAALRTLGFGIRLLLLGLIVSFAAPAAARNLSLACVGGFALALSVFAGKRLVRLSERIPDPQLAARTRRELLFGWIVGAAGVVTWFVALGISASAWPGFALHVFAALSWSVAPLVLVWRINSFTRSLCATLPSDHPVWQWLKKGSVQHH